MDRHDSFSELPAFLPGPQNSAAHGLPANEERLSRSAHADVGEVNVDGRSSSPPLPALMGYVNPRAAIRPRVALPDALGAASAAPASTASAFSVDKLAAGGQVSGGVFRVDAWRAGLNSQTVKLATLGALGGILSSIFGLGGGILIVPALVMALKMGHRRAHGTSLAAIIPISVAGAAGYAFEGSVDWMAAACLVAGSATLGAVLGTRLLHVIPRGALGGAFAVALVATAGRLLFDIDSVGLAGDFSAGRLVMLVGVGVVAGTLTGMLGVGGGLIMVPAMMLLADLPGTIAKGTSLAVMIPTAVVGTRCNMLRENADLRVAAIVGLVGAATSFMTSKISLRLDPVVSNQLLAALLVLVAAKTVYDQLWKKRAATPSVAVPN